MIDNVYKIFGAPGCGKTTRLMNILMEELKTNSPDRIAYVSFTRKGTYEGVNRAKELYGYKDTDLPYFRTLHSIAFRAGNFSKYDMISRADYKAFSDAMGMKFMGYYTEEFFNNDDQYLFAHIMRRNNPTTAASFIANMDALTLRNVEYNYVRFKQFAKVHDFTDVIEHFIQVNEPLPVDVAIIDEAQDLTSLQWRMCEIAFANCKRVYVAGDDDQAIYEWSGADVNYFLSLKADNTEILAKSYRLQKSILTLAKRVSSMISRRVDKDFEPLSDNGDVHMYNSLDDITLTKNESWYFLSRNNWFLSKYRDLLRKQACVFNDKDSLSYEPKHIAAINTFEICRKRGTITDTEEMRLKLFVKDKLDLTKPWFDNFNLPNDTIAYYRDLIKNKTDLQDRSMTIDTIHGVKGGEADNVVLMLDFTKAVRCSIERNPDAELRCLYVGITRAKKHLHIVHSNSNNGYDAFVRF